MALIVNYGGYGEGEGVELPEADFTDTAGPIDTQEGWTDSPPPSDGGSGEYGPQYEPEYGPEYRPDQLPQKDAFDTLVDKLTSFGDSVDSILDRVAKAGAQVGKIVNVGGQLYQMGKNGWEKVSSWAGGAQGTQWTGQGQVGMQQGIVSPPVAYATSADPLLASKYKTLAPIAAPHRMTLTAAPYERVTPAGAKPASSSVGTTVGLAIGAAGLAWLLFK